MDYEAELKKNLKKRLQSPNATSTDSMTIMKGGVLLLFRPNNYRRGIEVLGCLDSTKKRLGGTIGSKGLLYVVRDGVKLMLGKSKIVGIWSQQGRQVFCIQRRTKAELDDGLDRIKNEIVGKIDNAILSLVKDFNLKVKGDVFWVRHEDWIKGEDYIDKLPKDLIIYDTVFKKVYDDGLEFFGGKDKDGVGEVKSYIKNRVVEDFSPEIIKSYNETIRILIDPLSWAKSELALDNSHENLIRIAKEIPLQLRPYLLDYSLELKLKEVL